MFEVLQCRQRDLFFVKIVTFSRQAPAIEIEAWIPDERVTHVPYRLFENHLIPEILRINNVHESDTLLAAGSCAPPHRPRKAYTEGLRDSFNDKVRDQSLNSLSFKSHNSAYKKKRLQLKTDITVI